MANDSTPSGTTPETTIYRARRILTMHPARPEATHVAVREGRVLGAGALDELTGWGPHTLDERFADCCWPAP